MITAKLIRVLKFHCDKIHLPAVSAIIPSVPVVNFKTQSSHESSEMEYTPLERCLPRKIVDCLVRGPFPALLQIEYNDFLEGDEPASTPAAQIFFDPFGPGCKYLDLHFPRPTRVGEVQFVNHYTAFISLHVKTENTWHVAMTQKRLMVRPHTEEGSQDAVSLTEKDSSVPWDKVSQMRLIMRQPSAEWVDFEIDRLVVYGDEPKRVHKNVLYLGQRLEEMDAAVALTRLNTDEALRSSTYEDCYEFSSCLIYD